MKKFQAIKVRIAVFIILFVLAVFFVVPVHNKLTSLADNFVSSLTKKIENQTGLVISYSSLSPSILSTFSVQDIVIKEKNGLEILTIKKTKVNYNLRDLINLNIQKGIQKITIDGIKIDVSEMLEIAENFSFNQSSGDFDYKQIKTFIPGSIKLKNISVNYSDNQVTAEVFLHDLSLNNNLKKENIAFNLESEAKAHLKTINEMISCSIGINGTIPDDFENSYCYLSFNNISNGEYKIDKINLMANYADKIIDLQTIKSVNPLFISANYNVEKGDVNLNLRTENLSPASVVSSNQVNLRQFKNLLIDTNTKFYCNVNNKTMNYNSKGKVQLPDSIFPQSANVEYSLSGNEKKLNLERFDVNGPKCIADASLSYTFDKMQVSGFAELPFFILDNGNAISTELYFDPLDKGFMVFSPQVFAGTKALTALQFSFLPQNDSYDFVFEAYDYSHSDIAEPGIIKIDGSYLNNYLQGGISANGFYLDSLIDFGIQFASSELTDKLLPVKLFASDYILSGDVYASSDLKSISYSVPYFLVANTKKDNQFVMMAMNGNEQSIQLNQLSFILGKYAIEATASVDRNPDTNDMFVVADFNADSIPYHFSGTIMPEVINVTGDYGTDIEFRFEENQKMSGHVYFDGFPVKYGEDSIVFATESDFTYDTENGPTIAIKHFDAEGASAKYTVSPKLLMSGNVTKYGAQIDSIAYTDFYSALEGTADVMVNINDGIFDSVGLLMNVKNPLSEEAIIMDATISNPEHLYFDAKSLSDSLYINSQIQINNFSLNRISSVKNDNNLLTGSLFASGTLEHPYIALALDNLSLIMAGNFLKTWGSVTLEDKLLSVNDFNIDFQMLKIDDLKGHFSLDNFEGLATASIDSMFNGKNLHVPLKLQVSNTVKQPEKLLPDSTLITLSSDEINGSIITKPFGFDISAMYSNGIFNLFSSDNLGLFGTIGNDGSMQVSVNSKNYFSFNVSGFSNSNDTNVEVQNINVNLSNVFSCFDIKDFLVVDTGTLEGAVTILNSFDDPVLFGTLLVSDPSIKLPTIIPNKISAPETLITIANNEIQVQDTEYFVKGSNSANVGCTVYMNKWNVDHTDVTVRTSSKDAVKVAMVTPGVSLIGDIICNLKLEIEAKDLNVTGSIAGENIDLTSNLSSVSTSDFSSDSNVRADLDIILGNHASLNLDPLLRAVFVPNTHINLKMDQEENLYEIDGELKIKSGDIAYLNRNFYIKEGSIKFNKEDVTNPLVTINAETRERDDEGQMVTILLSVENQYLLNFTPKFSSIPAKSENELRLLLGQIIVADSNTAANFIFAAGDYAIQTAVIRKAENKLREVMNFDIFSLRTNVLQNAYILNTTVNSNNRITFSNFLDNSTVYMGKYFGSNIYLDFMFHINYENYAGKGFMSSENLIYQPELGLEMESPFGNIRWNIAPDINALMKNRFVPSTSVTLSWKFTY